MLFILALKIKLKSSRTRMHKENIDTKTVVGVINFKYSKQNVENEMKYITQNKTNNTGFGSNICACVNIINKKTRLNKLF